jgi:hypothetical protein
MNSSSIYATLPGVTLHDRPGVTEGREQIHATFCRAGRVGVFSLAPRRAPEAVAWRFRTGYDRTTWKPFQAHDGLV